MFFFLQSILENIFKNNLGRIKQNRFTIKIRKRSENYINKEVNNFFEKEKPTEIIKEDLTWETYKNKKKKGFRLPTEAEWEYAAKGGDVNIVYAGGDLHVGEPEDKEHTLLKTLAWYNKNSGLVTHEVAKKLPNDYGLYDMSGNVREWCNDWFVSKPLSNVERDPKGPTIPTGYRVTKGGGFTFGGEGQCRISSRDGTLAKQHENDRGFRIACRL